MNTVAHRDPNLQIRRRWQWLALAVGLGFLVWLLGPVLTPFIVSALLAWLGAPLVSRIERWGTSRTTAVVLVFSFMTLVIVLAVLLLIPLVESQVAQLVEWLPRLGAWMTATAVPWLEQRFDMELAPYFDPSSVIALLKQHWQEAGGVAATVLGGVTKSGAAIIGWMVNLALIPVVTFFFMRDSKAMGQRIRDLLPRPMEPTVVRLARESDDMLGGFLRGQMMVMISLGIIYGFGLWMVGVELGILIGLVAGLVSFVPYLGALVGIGAAVIATLVQHGDWMHLLLVLGVFAVGQTLESFLLTPWLVGDRIGLHPVAVIFAIMAGGQLFGFTGILLALPVAAVAMVLLRYLHQQYTESQLYGANDPDPDAHVPRIIVPDDDEPPPDRPQPAT